MQLRACTRSSRRCRRGARACRRSRSRPAAWPARTRRRSRARPSSRGSGSLTFAKGGTYTVAVERGGGRSRQVHVDRDDDHARSRARKRVHRGRHVRLEEVGEDHDVHPEAGVGFVPGAGGRSRASLHAGAVARLRVELHARTFDGGSLADPGARRCWPAAAAATATDRVHAGGRLGQRLLQDVPGVEGVRARRRRGLRPAQPGRSSHVVERLPHRRGDMLREAPRRSATRSGSR